MLEIKNISKSYGKIKAVDNLSFTVKKGEIFGLLGVNGAGKTTTFRVIMGLLDADEGSVKLNNKTIDYSQTDKIGFLTEERSLLTKLTVLEQCVYFGVLKGMKEKEVEKKLDLMLKEFEIEEYKHRKIKELSKGNQQKIQFITAIINSPELLILDEPFTGLDPINVDRFMKKIEELKEKGTMIIFSSHRMEHVELFCEKLLVLVNGKAVLEGYLKNIKKQYRRKNIFIKGSILKKDLENTDGVLEVKKQNEEYLVKIESDDYVEKVFEKIKGIKNITKFVVDEPSLNEIFVSKVGEKFEN